MTPLLWNCRDFILNLAPRPMVMGIVNVTPDSFSDGNRYFDASSATTHALRLVEEGADILDIGGESTRPGSVPVSAGEQLRRVLPVLEYLNTRVKIPLSIDTTLPEVACECLKAGASIVNDVSGFRDPDMAPVAREYRAGAIIMHMLGTPQTMQNDPRYQDVVVEVKAFFEARLQSLAEAGIPNTSVCLDPGIGFGKRQTHTLDLLANMGEFSALGRPICLGVSRKGFIEKVCGRQLPDRDVGSLAVACFVAGRGQAHVLRVHNVLAARDAALLLGAIDGYRR